MAKNIKEITIKVNGEAWNKALEEALKKANEKVKVDGFRQGKTPKDVFIKKYTQDKLNMDAVDIALQDEYVKMLDDNSDLPIIAQPDGRLDKLTDEGFEFTFILTLKPEVKLGKYKNLGIKKETSKVSKKEIEESIDEMRNRFKEVSEKEGKIALKDIAIIDFEGFKDGVAFPGGKAENYSLEIGSNSFIPGFEESLIGLSKGEKKDVELTFPEDYHAEDLKGAKVVFKVKVNEVKQQIIPELNDTFFEDLQMEGINSKETLEKELEKTIMARKDMEADNKYIDELLKAAAKNVEVEIPDVMLDEELNRMLGQYQQNLQMQGITLEQFYKFTNSDEQALKEQMKEEAINRITYRLMLEEIAKIEKIDVSDEEADNEATEMAKKYQMEKEDFLKQFGGLDIVKYDIKMKKAIEKLKEN